VKLGGNEARLLFHEQDIVSPGVKEFFFIGFGQREDVNEYNGIRIYFDLTLKRKGRV